MKKNFNNKELNILKKNKKLNSVRQWNNKKVKKIKKLFINNNKNNNNKQIKNNNKIVFKVHKYHKRSLNLKLLINSLYSLNKNLNKNL